MPELPDVEVCRRYFDATSLHQPVAGLHVPSPGVLSGTTPQGLGRALSGRAFEGTRRHGKYLFARLGDDRHLVLHFGMTGTLEYARKPTEAPRFTACLFRFENGASLAYVSPRKLGGIGLAGPVEAFIEEHELGPDALSLSLGTFRELTREHRGSVKSWLMNQAVLAGIGNVYSDEILFQARIHPRQPLPGLTDASVAKLHRQMGCVLNAAINAHARPGEMPEGFLLPHRKAGGRCPGCGREVASVEISGRTAWYCPTCQPPP